MNVYDFDGTIYDGDSSIDFFKYCLSKNKKILFKIFPIGISIILNKLKLISKEKLKSTFFSFIKNIDVEKEVQEFWQKNENKIKAFYKRQHKDTDIIISASPEFLLKPISKKLNVTLIATKVNTKTGKLEGKNCKGEEKIIRLKELTNQKINEFYSDSKSDEPLKQISQKSFLVNNDKISVWK